MIRENSCEPQHNSYTMDLSAMDIADELLDTLYSGATPEEERRMAHYIWLTWFRKQPARFQRQAVKRYRVRREQAFESMYEAVR